MSGGLNSLATIIKRLEAATSRLEDIAAAQGAPVAPLSAADLDGSAPPTAGPTPTAAKGIAAPAAPAEDPKSVTAYDELILQGKIKPFVELSKSFAAPAVVEAVTLVEKQFTDLRGLLLKAGACQKPDAKAIEQLLIPLQKDIEAVQRCKEANRKERDWLNHLTVLAEGAPCIGWVVQVKPGPYVGEIKDSVAYYGNRIMKEFKDKDPKHVEWVRGFTGILDELRKYVLEYHTTGLAWNPKGTTIDKYSASPAAPAPAAGGAPPPPPPPPPPPVAPPAPAATSAAPAAGAAAVFAELNRGEEVTKGLRKVDKSEMTHKNPALRAGSTVPSSVGTTSPPTAKKPLRPTKPQALMGKKPAKLALEGKAWNVEYQENEPALTLEDVQMNQTVNLFNCKKSTIVIKGKVNAVSLVNCEKTSILVDSVVSSISVTKSPNFAIQITGVCPTIQLDSTDVGQIYLSKDSLAVEITTAKCSSINVSLPVEGEEEGVFEEQPVPEMLKTVVQGGKLVSSIVEHAG
ncbi:hypothetical protein K525DRAFT_290851 [Schizophyllum commune Loenen D]|nr:hypothetical protein K525DRAFT_290851 [Schizophyllum commune Loenen D]